MHKLESYYSICLRESVSGLRHSDEIVIRIADFLTYRLPEVVTWRDEICNAGFSILLLSRVRTNELNNRLRIIADKNLGYSFCLFSEQLMDWELT